MAACGAAHHVGRVLLDDGVVLAHGRLEVARGLVRHRCERPHTLAARKAGVEGREAPAGELRLPAIEGGDEYLLDDGVPCEGVGGAAR